MEEKNKKEKDLVVNDRIPRIREKLSKRFGMKKILAKLNHKKVPFWKFRDSVISYTNPKKQEIKRLRKALKRSGEYHKKEFEAEHGMI